MEETEFVNKEQFLLMVNTPLEILHPLTELLNSFQEEPPFVEYFHAPYVKFCRIGVNVIVSGVYVFPPSIDLNTCDEALILAL